MSIALKNLKRLGAICFHNQQMKRYCEGSTGFSLAEKEPRKMSSQTPLSYSLVAGGSNVHQQHGLQGVFIKVRNYAFTVPP